MLPKKEFNIYPKNDENIKSVVEFYFNKHDVDQNNIIETINLKTSLSLNQIEFIIRKLSEAYVPIFRTHLNGNIALTNLFTYGVDALERDTINKYGSKARQMITQEFKDFVKKTEVDLYSSDKNN